MYDERPNPEPPHFTPPHPPTPTDTGASGTDELYFYSPLLPAEVLGFSSFSSCCCWGRKRMSAPQPPHGTSMVLSPCPATPPPPRYDLQLASARKEKLGLKKEPQSIIMSPSLKPPSSKLGGVQPYLEERSERGPSDSRGWRRLEKIFWLWTIITVKRLRMFTSEVWLHKV